MNLKKLALEVAPAVSGVLIVVSYWPQIIQTLTTKNVEGQNPLFWLILAGSLLGFTIQQIGIVYYRENKEEKPSYNGVISQGLNLFFALMMLVMVLMFK